MATAMLTLTQAAEQLQIHVDTIKRWHQQGMLPLTKLPGGGWRVSEDDLARLLEQGHRAGGQV